MQVGIRLVRVDGPPAVAVETDLVVAVVVILDEVQRQPAKGRGLFVYPFTVDAVYAIAQVGAVRLRLEARGQRQWRLLGHATQRTAQQARAYITDRCIIEVAEGVVGVAHHPFHILLLEGLHAVPDVDGHAADRQCQQGLVGQQQADEVHQAPAQRDDRLRIHFLGRHAVGIGLGDQRLDLGPVIDKKQVIVHCRGFYMCAQAPLVQKALHRGCG